MHPIIDDVAKVFTITAAHSHLVVLSYSLTRVVVG
jgi:hypothetical protein